MCEYCELKHKLMLNKEMSWVPCYLKYEADKVIARHKYKRCMAMAKYCEAMRGHYLSYEEPKWFWYRKWSERWQGLAEKFKEAK